MKKLLENQHNIRWNELKLSNGGAATDLPVLFSDLATKPGDRLELVSLLYDSLCTQGYVANAAAESIPILIELLQLPDMTTSDKVNVLKFLNCVSDGMHPKNRAQYEDKNHRISSSDYMDDAIIETNKYFPFFLSWIDRKEPEIRQVLYDILGSDRWFPRLTHQKTVDRTIELLQSEIDDTLFFDLGSLLFVCLSIAKAELFQPVDYYIEIHDKIRETRKKV